MSQDGAGLKFRTEEWEALALKWNRLPESEREHFNAQMTRAQARRFERMLAKVHDGRRNYSNEMTTRQDVVQILALYIERNLLPMAHRLDKAEADIAYLRLPWWKKIRLWLYSTFNGVLAWLESKGITLVVPEPTPEPSAETQALTDFLRDDDEA